MAIEVTSGAAYSHRPDVVTLPLSETIPDAFILSHSTVAGRVEGDAPSCRVPWVSDASATFSAEAAEISESDPALSETVVYTGKLTQYVSLSRELYYQSQTPTLIAASVSRAVTNAANDAFLSQANPTSPAVNPPGGLVNTSGIVDGGAVDGNLDGLIDLLATLEGNGAAPSAMFLAPDAWASLRKFKQGTGSEVGILGAGTNDAARMLLGVPVVVTGSLADGTGLVVDRNDIVSAVGPLEVMTSEHVLFQKDSIAMRATFRMGAKAVHADRLGKFSVTAPVEA